MKSTFIKVAATASAIFMLAGCGGAATSSTSSAGLSTIKSGVLTVGLSPDFPPMEYLDPKTNQLTGADVDLVNEIAKRLNLKVEFTQQKFDQLVNSVKTERVDITFSGMSDTVARQKTVDFVDYFKSVGRFYTLAANKAKYTKATDACGQAVAVSSATDYFPKLQQFSKDTCESAGLPAVNIIPTDSGAAARLQLDQGRATLAIQGAENLVYFAQQDPGKYDMVLPDLTNTPFGAAVKKGNTALADKVRDAFAAMNTDGTTKKILDKYNVGYGLMAPAINGVK
ncbi:polar amino acid transport system substrate-binding protein [Arthrobacter silviterrae]|uniref:ABC transporter substrate-binding protein n=1 Tax=Arthrobacter silviterrae TaxID=2026658 RepID=A0ABX0DKE6_9MICC|nr:ABC transporter substrate-binding protein [Arthrobacter silviterrae]MDQ0276455.1 polar amino acid transport system substrate-binding protein [Arthrobacter silviterrae]NGN84707.1 ABC transporter substrate-binding protein [Arthrobacter silviterrae]